jgi:4a-hydroxytetrahydrobiopterin dehydratase
MRILSEVELHSALQTLPSWERRGQRLIRELRFPNFVTAVGYVNRLVEPAEALGHHPDLEVGWGRVVISLTTHDAGGLTDLDLQLATAIDRLDAQAR